MGEEGDVSKLVKVFEAGPLLLQEEVEGKLAEVEKWVARGIVGCKTLQPPLQKSKLYWMRGDATEKLQNRAPDFSSPRPPKRQKVTPCNGDKTLAFTPGEKEEEGGKQEGINRIERLVQEKASLERKLREKEERLDKLKLVKLYRTKNDLPELDVLVAKWRQASQEIAETLLANSCRDPAPSMNQLLDYLHIDPSLIRYSTEQDAFY